MNFFLDCRAWVAPGVEVASVLEDFEVVLVGLRRVVGDFDLGEPAGTWVLIWDLFLYGLGMDLG